MSTQLSNYTKDHKSCGCSGGAKCGCNSRKTLIASSFSRPNFFAGQMLTDEDLRDAMNYMVEKNRLHNRHFLGEGVVCGLQVVPHPCSESRGKVIVKKGHAINGCGDDILVIREHELDILQMVRERLVEKYGRSDCGDPCRDRQFDQADINAVRSELQELLRQREFALNGRKQEIEESIRKNQAKLEELVLQATPVKYGLYVRYEEQMTDFVTPYQTDTCGTVNCQGSRIREGYQFELRCATSLKYPDLRSSIQQCAQKIPEFESIQGRILHAISTLEIVQKVVSEYKSLAAGFAGNDEQAYKDDLKKKLLESVTQVESTVAKVNAAIASSVRPSSEDQRGCLAAIHRLYTLAIRMLEFDAELFKSQIISDPIKKLFDSPTNIIDVLDELRNVTQTIRQPPAVGEPLLQMLKVRLVKLQTFVVESDSIRPGFDTQADAVGELVQFALVQDALVSLDQINTKLLGYMRSGEIDFSPDLRLKMFGVNLNTYDTDYYLLQEELLESIVAQARVVTRAVSEVVRQCMCDLLLPPCPLDSDGSVLIANITVDACAVVDICNLARRIVISGPALRYWFSDFRGILDPLRESCCPPPDLLSKKFEDESRRLAELTERWKVAARGKPENRTYELELLKKAIDGSDFWDNISQWENLHAGAVKKEFLVAITPSTYASDILSVLAQTKPDQHQQELNTALAALAARPDADLRNILDWTDNITSPASVMKVANAANNTAELAKAAVDGAANKADAAKINADSAKSTADSAKATADTAKTTADTAKTTADTAKTTADTAKTAADSAKTTADSANTTADTAKTTADAAKIVADTAKSTADTAKTTADTALTTADTAKTSADAAKIAADTAKSTADTAKTTADTAQTTADAAKNVAVAASTSASSADTKAQEAKDGLANKVNSGTFTALRDAFATHTNHPPGNP